jgi:hypothetical protein
MNFAILAEILVFLEDFGIGEPWWQANDENKILLDYPHIG